MFHTKFNISFRRLVLLEMNCFEKIIKRALQKFAMQCKSSWCKVLVHLLLQHLADSVLIFFAPWVTNRVKKISNGVMKLSVFPPRGGGESDKPTGFEGRFQIVCGISPLHDPAGLETNGSQLATD